ncbi:MAG: hypothetical protein HY077_16945 [Elusimicrobia bacterium]|nr:hypothetical protein [Elusimicrobiota bacterium]
MRKGTCGKDLILAEFAVTVRESGIDFDGLDAVLWRLIHAKPKDGFLPNLRAAARQRRRLERAK